MAQPIWVHLDYSSGYFIKFFDRVEVAGGA